MIFPQVEPPDVINRLQHCWNAHDLEGLMACFHSDYESVQPFHPERNFKGQANLRASWGATFEALSMFQAELRRYSIAGSMVWTEWRWHGCHPSGVPYESVGVMIFELESGKIIRATIYSEVLTSEGPDWDNVLGGLLHDQRDGLGE